MNRLKPDSQPSTYGLACTNCYKAKCRCVRTPTGDKCERCLRLKKRCEPSESVRRRNAQTAEDSDARIARLEDKIEGLFSVMGSLLGLPEASGASGTSESSVNIPQPLDTDSISSSRPYSTGNLVNPSSTSLGFSEGTTLATDLITPVSLNSNPSSLPDRFSLSPHVPLPSQVDDRLHFFRTRMLPSFPFIDLTPNMTSWYLRQTRPILFQAIHTVTTFSTQERLPQVEELKRLLFTSALVKVQSSIDLLLGLLTYVAWSTDAFLGRADLISRLMMLSISLVYDLRLFKPSSPDVQVMMTMTQGREDDDRSPENDIPYELLERQRAVLACFFLSSNISSHLGRQDAIRWTPQMEEALRVITMNQSCPGHQPFVFQVRLQLLKQRADDIRQQDETDCARTGTTPTASVSVPRLLYIKTLRRQLDELRSSFPPGLLQRDILNTHAQYVELYINQLAYSTNRDSVSLYPSGKRGDSEVLLEFERFQYLWQSVESIKSWLDNFYRIPCSKIVGQPFHFWSQMILTITLLKYLSTLKDPEWDCQAVRNTVHLISTMDCMLQKLNLSSKEPELECDDHLLAYLCKLLTRCRLWAEAQWNMTSQTQDVGASRNMNPDTSYQHHIPDVDQMVWMQSIDLGDDQWFEDVLGMPTTFG